MDGKHLALEHAFQLPSTKKSHGLRVFSGNGGQGIVRRQVHLMINTKVT